MADCFWCEANWLVLLACAVSVAVIVGVMIYEKRRGGK